MSRTYRLTSAKTVILRERLKLKNNPTKEKVFSVMVVRVLVTFDLSVLLISRNNIKVILFPDLMKMIMNKNQMMKVQIISELLLRDVNLMKTLMMLPMMNSSIPMKKLFLKERNKGKL